MDARIFCLKSQKTTADRVEARLRAHIFPEIRVERIEIDDQYGRQSDGEQHGRCKLFLGLFKASMIKVDDFAIVVSDGRGGWYYLGGAYNSEPYLLELFQQSMPSLFPSVAILNRMVIMPETVGEAFEKSRVFPWFVKPRDLEGVVLVDFQNLESVDVGMRQVATQLETDIAKLCKRHMLIRRIEKPDFTELGQLLSVAPEYFELHHDQILAPSARLTSRIVSGPAQLGTASRVVLEIRCESEYRPGSVRVQVKGPAGTLPKPVSKNLSLAAGKDDAQHVHFDVVPAVSPYCPLEVLLTIDDAQPVAPPFPIPLILDVQA